MDQGSRLIWEIQCGRREEQLFKNVIEHLFRIIEQTNDLTLVTDGERRYENLLFDICHEEILQASVVALARRYLKVSKFRARIKALNLIKREETDHKIKHLNQNILIQNRLLKTKLFTLIM
jgi:hypothetical protein